MNNPFQQAQQLLLKGSGLLQSGKPAEALNYFLQAQVLTTANPIFYLYAGAALHDLGRYEEAVSTYQSALQIASDIGEIHNNLGNSLMALGRFTEAADRFYEATRLLNSSPVPLTALATVQQALGNIMEAETSCRMALSLNPDFAEAHWNLALNLLLQGRYSEGWQEYEWRWRKAGFTSPCRHTDIPMWDGSPLHGRTILLHAEQGFGDAIQFVRYVPLVTQQGGSVVLECHPQLVSLFQGLEGMQAVVPFGTSIAKISCQAPLLSLPHIFKTTLENIPSITPYLSTATEYRKKWAALMSDYLETLRIGLIWAGKSYPDPLRSCQLSDFAALSVLDNTTFFSLQIGAGAEQAASPPDGIKLMDLTGSINNFSDTAAHIEQLDLVISIDTATAHLAGALCKPTWILLPFAPDWRWLLKRNDSPWYPTMRLFRQKQQGDWRPAIEMVRTAIEESLSVKTKNPSK